MTTETATPKTKRDAADIHLGTAPLHSKHILFATDFSSYASAAFEVAAQLSQHFGSKLYMAHVITPMLYAVGGGVITPALQEVEMKQAHMKLANYFARMPKLASIQHEEIVTCGSAKELIREIVEDKNVDLVVMGSHGRGGIAKLALGSVAESALRHLHCPVLVCGPQCKRTFHPFKSIVLATDLSISSLRPAQYASALTEEFHARLTIGHVNPADSPKNGPIHADQKQEEVEAIDKFVPVGADVRKHTQYNIRSGDPASELLRLAKLTNANLIVMGAQGKGAFADRAPWAILSNVIREARCPVLAVQPHFA
jgi:nucleotide-binding universal stress UspA family protein